MRRSISLTLLLTVLFQVGCTSPRLAQFEAFAAAGQAYVDAQSVFIEEAKWATVEADTALLVRTRHDLDVESLEEEIIAANLRMRERLEILSDIQRHSILLRSYFVTLGQLAKSDASSELGQASAGLVNSLGQLNERIQNAQIGERSVADFVGASVPIVVRRFQSAALNRELRQRASIIERELNLQRSAIKAIGAELKVDAQVQLNLWEYEQVVRPYVARGKPPLPVDWSKKRQNALLARQRISSADAAVDAAERLRLSFVALVEGRFSASDLPLLIDDINRMVTVVELLRQKSD